MSALAFPTTDFRPALPMPARRRHLTVVPALDAPAAPEQGLVAPNGSLDEQRRGGERLAGERRAGERVAAMDIPLRLTVRGRRVVIALAFGVAAILGSVLGTALSGAEALPAQVNTVTVQPGESLWTIASAAAAPGEDVRVVIDQIMALNGLESSTLVAGDELTVPAN